MAYKNKRCCDPFQSHKKQIYKNLREVPYAPVGVKSLTRKNLICPNCVTKCKKFKLNYIELDHTVGLSASSSNNPISSEDETAVVASTNEVLSILEQTPIKRGMKMYKIILILIFHLIIYHYQTSSITHSQLVCLQY